MIKRTIALFMAASCAGAPAFAHHSFAAFNPSQQLTLHATVVELEWKNPHSWLEIEALDTKGANHEWGIEMGAPSALLRTGWRPRIIAPGDKLTVTIAPNRDGSYGGSMIKAVKADGTVLGGRIPR